MYPRPNYVEKPLNPSELTDDWVAMEKADGSNFHAVIQPDGSIRLFSRRESVKGGYPERTAALPHLTKPNPGLEPYAGSVVTGELVFTGKTKNGPEQHAVLSGILNSLPLKAVATQSVIGPVRFMPHNVVQPGFKTFREKLIYIDQLEKAFGNPDIFFGPELYIGRERINDLIQKTKAENKEGVIVTHLDRPEEQNPRIKLKHKSTFNLKIVGIQQAEDIHGKLKEEAGAFLLEDGAGKPAGKVGTGLSKAQRIDAHFHPENWINKHIQVISPGSTGKAMRQGVFNGDADGDLDVL